MRLPAEVGNQVLDALPTTEYRRLITRMRPVELPRGKVLFNAGDEVDVAYFPVSGVISLLSTTESGEIIEVGMVGNEGTTCLPIIAHQQEIPYRVVVQIAGHGVKIDSETVRREFLCAGRFHDLLICYTHSLFAEITQSAVCNRFHVAEARFSRWLLSMHDRVAGDTLSLTHEIISNMLGAERSNVTRIARIFQNKGLIQYRYGSITILNRAGLETASCECYAAVKQSIKRCRAA